MKRVALFSETGQGKAKKEKTNCECNRQQLQIIRDFLQNPTSFMEALLFSGY
jgi:hypothetical protein